MKLDRTLCQPENVEVTPMLIQPYVESGVHGLRIKTPREGKVIAAIRLQDQYLTSKICDNGIEEKSR